MRVIKSPTKQIREKLQLTQTQFAAAAGVSKGHMSEVETGIAPLGEKLKRYLEELSIDVKAVEREHRAYMDFKKKQYRAQAARAIQEKAEKK